MRAYYTLLFVILLCSCSASALNAQTQKDRILDTLRQTITTLAETDQLPGFAVALVDADGIIYEAGFGYANLAQEQSYTPRTTQNIGSISKTFIGISLLQAERAGHLKMTDPINKYLPFKVVHPRYPKQPILLQHLADHTAGISDDKNYESAYILLEELPTEQGSIPKAEYKDMLTAKGNDDYSLGEYLRRFFTPGGRYYHKKNFTKAAPGVTYEYSNVGAALAAYVLECATKTPFDKWTEQHIFQPLKMDNTGWGSAQVDPATHFTHYFGNRQAMPDYKLTTYPDGGVCTSIHQLALYCAATITGMEKGNEILPREAYQRLLQNQVRVPKDESSYGTFWERMDSGFYGHSGGDPGIATLMYVSEETGYGHLVFTSGSPKDGGFYMAALMPLIRAGRKLAALDTAEE